MDSSLWSARNDASASVNCIYRDHSFFGRAGLKISTQPIRVFPQSVPNLALFFDGPRQAKALACVAQRHVIEIAPLPMAGLNAPQTPLHFVAIFQAAGLDGFRQALQGVLHAPGETLPDGLLFFLAACRTGSSRPSPLPTCWSGHTAAPRTPPQTAPHSVA